MVIRNESFIWNVQAWFKKVWILILVVVGRWNKSNTSALAQTLGPVSVRDGEKSGQGTKTRSWIRGRKKIWTRREKAYRLEFHFCFRLWSLKLVYNIICFFITGPVNTEIIEEVDESGRPKQVNKVLVKVITCSNKKILIKFQPFTYFSVANWYRKKTWKRNW